MLNILKKIYHDSPKQNIKGILKKLNLKTDEPPQNVWNIGNLEDIDVVPFKWNNKQKTNYDEIDFSDIEFYDEVVLADIENLLQGTIEETNYRKSEMSYKDRAFLNGIIRKAKPKVIVEIGLSAGGSSSVILNAIRDMENTKLYSFDYNTIWYRDVQKKQDKNRKTGFLVHQIVPDLEPKWKLSTGGVPCKYLDVLPQEGIDICFIDTAHFNPGEHLNILEIFPFMKKNGIIIYHDTAYHALTHPDGMTTCVAINTLNGKRILLKSEKTIGLPNIEAIVLDENVENMLYGLFSNLSLPWRNKVSNGDFIEMFKHFSKYYSADLVKIYVFYSCFYMSGGLRNKKLARQFAETYTKQNIKGIG
ncbi:class I SAM-dependent methyltransferase [Pararhodonellum marinum]|uniref:class I SAM-dependent methyltransferase n=1 Tax=Pararhodonellum marinum TaxID=2755358 RepID=UPI00188EBCE9|nr:class I SAM-dependent methyltransferase [Pararhodonellum marinum]